MLPITNAPHIICTIIPKRAIAAARVLMASVAQQHPEAGRVVLVLDDAAGYFQPTDEAFHVLTPTEIGVRSWPHLRVRYDSRELTSAVKPALLRWLLGQPTTQQVIYLDASVYLYQPLTRVFALLETQLAVLMPHILAPIADTARPSEQDFLQSGVYNAGCIGLSKNAGWEALLGWWEDKTRLDCVYDPEKGYWLDQHWLDLLPSFFEQVHILREAAYNVGRWNFRHRHLRLGADGLYYVDDTPLVFIQFGAWFRPDSANGTGQTLPATYQACFEDYLHRLREAGSEQSEHWPYTYATFPDGVPIPKALRHCLRQHDPNAERWPDPYRLDTPDNFRTWATQQAPELPTRMLTPYTLALYQTQAYLQQAFPDVLNTDEPAYAKWLIEAQGNAEEFHTAYVAPIERLLSDRKASAPTAKHEAAPDTSQPSKALVGLGERWRQTWRYYRQYPQKVQPYLPPDILDHPSKVYTGPDGLYKWLRYMVTRWGLQRSLRRWLGLRVVLSARYFFAYPSQEMQVLSKTQDKLPAAQQRYQDGGVNIIGYLYSESGVGQAARNALSALAAIDYPTATLPIETYDTARKSDKFADQFEQGAYYPTSVFHINADMTLPVYNLLGEGAYDKRYNIGFWFWETADFPDHWEASFDVYDEIWVGSSFVQMSIAPTSPIPVVKISLPTVVELPEASKRDDFGLPSEAFIFMYVFDALSVIERKNPLGLVAAYAQAFSEAERAAEVHLVIKTTNLAHYPDEAEQLREAVAEVGGTLIESYFDRVQTNALINACDAYVSLHRAEGYGFTIAEAMYLGKPVIATAYSGNMDFMRPDNSYMVPYELVTLAQDYAPYRAGDRWAQPDLSAAAALMREVYTQPDAARKRGQTAAQHIRTYRNQAACGRVIAERLSVIKQKRGPNT